MGLREWLMILGGVILLLIIADGIRRMRKAEVNQDKHMDEEEKARQEQLRRELPAGGARVIQTHNLEVFDDDPIPVLRHEVEVPGFKDSDPNLSSRFSAHSDDLSELDFGSAPQASVQDDSPTPYSDASADFQEGYADEQASYTDLPDEQADVNNAQTGNSALAGDSADDPNTYSDTHSVAAADQVEEDLYPAPEEELHVTEFQPLPDSSLDDLEPLEPLEQRFAEEQSRRQEALRAQEERAAAEAAEAAEAQAQLEAEDPVKAAARRILGKHTGPRPSERMAQQQTEISLAEQQYLAQQVAHDKASAERMKEDQIRKARSQVWPQPDKNVEPPANSSQAQQAHAQAQRSAPASQADEPAPKKSAPVRRKPLLSADAERDQISGADELLVLHVKCKDSRGFHGSALLHVVMQCGMQFGEMGVFHRFVKTSDGPQIQFSMLSSVEPGVFDMDAIDDLYIPSVTFLMGLPAPGSSQECFTMMIETAKVIVRHLNGELRDEDRSVMTPQTVEHYKQRIQEFERRKQLARMR